MNMYQPPLEPYDDYDPMEDWVHVDELEKYDNAEEFLKEVINHVYNTGDIDELENSLDELAGVFNLKLPNKQPLIAKKEPYENTVQLNAINQ